MSCIGTSVPRVAVLAFDDDRARVLMDKPTIIWHPVLRLPIMAITAATG
jgi:hypothetical protein